MDSDKTGFYKLNRVCDLFCFCSLWCASICRYYVDFLLDKAGAEAASANMECHCCSVEFSLYLDEIWSPSAACVVV